VEPGLKRRRGRSDRKGSLPLERLGEKRSEKNHLRMARREKGRGKKSKRNTVSLEEGDASQEKRRGSSLVERRGGAGGVLGKKRESTLYICAGREEGETCRGKKKERCSSKGRYYKEKKTFFGKQSSHYDSLFQKGGKPAHGKGALLTREEIILLL